MNSESYGIGQHVALASGGEYLGYIVGVGPTEIQVRYLLDGKYMRQEWFPISAIVKVAAR